MKSFLLLIGCSLLGLDVLAQNNNVFMTEQVSYIPPSPNAASLMEYASIPVSLHTGTAEVAVPLFELKGRKLNVPISVSYHASGIKVQDYASSVGLGWALNAGGVVTRIIRGLPDEDATKGYFNLNFNTTYDNSNGMVAGNVDSEPDIFLFNFGGKTGRVVLNPSKVPIQLPEQNFKITVPDFSSSDPTWEITDTDGVKYIFGKSSAEREVSSVIERTQYSLPKYWPASNTPFTDKPFSAITSWYLSEIKFPFNEETVSFAYQSGSNIPNEYYRQSLTSIIDINPQCDGFDVDLNLLDNLTLSTVQSPKYISSIKAWTGSSYQQFIMGTVSFSYAFDRNDISLAARLTGVNLINKDNETIKSYRFDNNQYFTSDGCSTSDCKRLKLGSITEITNGANLQTRSFSYDLANLPSRKSVKYDHWGYYNDNSYTYHDVPCAIPASKIYNDFTVQPIPPFAGADKSPVLSKSRANVLTQITNSLGGYQKLYYELNQYDDNGSFSDTGGLRIAKIEEDDGTGINGMITKNYTYKQSDLITHAIVNKSSGNIYRKFSYDFPFYTTYMCDDGFGGSSEAELLTANRYSSSLIDIFDIGGMHVGYSEVEVVYGDGSKEYSFFTTFADRPDDDLVDFSTPTGYYDNNNTDNDGPPFISKGDRSFERGLLKEHIVFNGSEKKLKRTVNHYDFYLASSTQAPGARAMMTSSNEPFAPEGKRGKYVYTHRGVRLLEAIDTTFDQQEETKYVVNRSTFTYNAKVSNSVYTRTDYLNDGNELKKQYTYPNDYYISIPGSSDAYAAGVYALGEAHIVVPVEMLTYLRNPSTSQFEVIGGEVVTFQRESKSVGTIARMEGIYKLKVPSPITSFTGSSILVGGDNGTFDFGSGTYKKVHTFSAYDDYANLLTETFENGESMDYTWGDNSSLVSSITKNGAHVSHYTYKPMVGLATATDPNSIVTSYEYDRLNRLEVIKDNDNAITNRYRYNYKTGNEFQDDFTIQGTYPGSPVSVPSNILVKGLPVGFASSSDIETSGQSKYVWDFGDGEVVDNASASQSHTYTTTGTKTVKLSKINPEYGTLTTIKSVSVYSAPFVAITVTLVSTYGKDVTLNFAATTTNGCPANYAGYSFSWSYGTSSSGTGTSVPGNQSAIQITRSSTLGTYYVRCAVVDPCKMTGVGVTPSAVGVE